MIQLFTTKSSYSTKKILFLLCWLIGFSSLSAQSLFVKVGTTTGTALEVEAGKPFILDLSYTLPPGCDEVTVTLPNPTYVSTPVVATSGWSVVASFPNTVLQFSGSSGTGNVQLNYNLTPGQLCIGDSIFFQAELTFDGPSCTAMDMTSNQVAVIPTETVTRTVSTTLDSDPLDLCIGGFAKFKIVTPNLGPCGSVNLDNVVMDFMIEGNATIVSIFDNSYTTIPFTSSFSGGTTTATFNSPILTAYTYKIFYVIVQFPCADYTPGMYDFSTTLSAEDPCNDPYSFVESPNNFSISDLCCSTSNAVPQFSKSLVGSIFNFCPGGCQDNIYYLNFDNTFNSQTYNGLVLTDDIPADVIVNYIHCDQLSTYLDNPTNEILFEYEINGTTWLNKTVKQVPGAGELAAGFDVYGTASTTNLGLAGTDVITELKWNFLNPVDAWADYIRVRMNFTLDPGASGTINNIATAEATSPALNSAVNLEKTVQDCKPNLFLNKYVYPTAGPAGSPNTTIAYANPGDKLRYRLMIRNNGAGPLTAGMVTDNLPAQLDYCGNPTYYYGTSSSIYPITSTTPPVPVGGTLNYDAGLHQLTFNGFSLPNNCPDDPMNFLIIEFDVEVQAGTLSGTYPNNFTATGTGAFLKTSPAANIVVNDYFELQGILTVDCSQEGTFADTSVLVTPGSAVYYRYEIKNVGNIAVDDVRVFNLRPQTGDLSPDACQTRNSDFTVSYLSTPVALLGTISGTGTSNTASCSDDPCSLSGFGPFNTTQTALKWETPAPSILYPGDSYVYRVEGLTDGGATLGETALNDFAFCARRLDISANTPPAFSNLATVTLADTSCQSGPDSIDCERLLVNSRAIQAHNNDCCWELTFINPYDNVLTGIELNALGGVQFSYSNALSGYSLNPASTPTYLLLDPPGGFVPAGAVGSVQICLDANGVFPQVIEGNFLIGEERICPFSQTFDCPAQEDEIQCADITNDSIYCQNDTFYYEFCFSNDPMNTFSIGSFFVLPSGGVTLDNISLPSGMTVSPMGGGYLFVPGTPLAPGTSICTVSATLGGVVPGQNIAFPVNAHLESIPPFYTCCFDSLNVARVTVPEACGPGCEDVSVELLPVLDAAQEHADCCYDLQLANLSGFDFDQIQANVLTPGISFSSYISNPGWTLGVQTPSSVSWTPDSGLVPMGNSIPGRFCLVGITNPKLIEIVWLDGQETVCRDTLEVECSAANTDCAEVTTAELICEGDQYILNFTVMNNSSFTADELTVASSFPSIYEVLPVSIPAGGTSGTLSLDLTSYGLIPGSVVCLTIGIHDLNDLGFSTSCCQGVTVCFVVPPCGENCDCGEWEKLYISDKYHQSKPFDVACDDIITLPCKSKQHLYGQYLCAGDCPADGYQVNVTNNGTGLTQSYPTSSTLNLPLFFTTPGMYTVDIVVMCGDKICRCQLKVNVKCKICPPPFEPAEDAVIKGFRDDIDQNFGQDSELYASYWERNGEQAPSRSLLQFDLSEIPGDANITTASLSLYANQNSDDPERMHQTVRGKDNSFLLQRVMPGPDNEWIADLITWNNQPEVVNDTTNLRFLGAVSIIDYLCIDVLKPVEKMVQEGNNGWLLRLEEESDPTGRSIAFNAREFDLEQRRPTLEVCYEEPVDVVEISRKTLDLTVSPNPTQNIVMITFSAPLEAETTLRLIGVNGRRLQERVIQTGTENHEMSLEENSSGVYFLEFWRAGQLIGLEAVVKAK